MRRALGTLSLAVSLFAPCLVTSPAWAQEKDDLARRHFESGAAYYAEAEYEDALKAFRKAYELSNRPEILQSIAAAQERLGDLNAAIESLNEYLLRAPDATDAETVRLRRDNLAKRAETQPPPEKQTRPALPPPAPPAEPAEAPAPAPEVEPASRLPVYIALSVGALSGIGAAITGLGAKAEYDELETRCRLRTCSDGDIESGENLALTSTILTGVSVASLGVGLVLWIVTDDEPPDERVTASGSPRVWLSADTEGGYAAARWSF